MINKTDSKRVTFSMAFILGQRPNLLRLLIVTLVFFLIGFIYKNGFLQSWELATYDKLLQQSPIIIDDTPITVITMTEEDINAFKNHVISDELLATILTKIESYQPRVVGIDIYRNWPVMTGIDKLEQVLTEYHNIIAVMKYGGKNSLEIPPPPILKNTNRFGFSNFMVDEDGIFRRGIAYTTKKEGAPLYSLAFYMAVMYRNMDNTEDSAVDLINKIPRLKPDDGGYVDIDTRGHQFLLDFCSPSPTITHYGVNDFLSAKTKILAEDFKDKIVLLGFDAKSVKDHFSTPCNKNKMLVSGVMLHAAVIDQYLRIAQGKQKPMGFVSDNLEILWVLFWVLAAWFISQWQYSFLRLFLNWGVGLGLIVGITKLLFANDYWLIVVTPSLAWILSSLLTSAHRAAQEKRERSQLMSLFSKHVAPEIAEDIWQKRRLFLLDGHPHPQEAIATVMFTDLQGFTTISERMKPSALFDWLNEYLEAMTPLVSDYKGVVVRFIGDAIFAGFGIPVPHLSSEEIAQDAKHAVECALAMNEKLIQLNKQWERQGLPKVGMRIGLYTGAVAAGSIGANKRMEYTLHGDTVNTAARLETFDKLSFSADYFKLPCRIFIGESTVDYLGDQFLLEKAGKVELRGKEETVTIYQVMGQT